MNALPAECLVPRQTVPGFCDEAEAIVAGELNAFTAGLHLALHAERCDTCTGDLSADLSSLETRG